MNLMQLIQTIDGFDGMDEVATVLRTESVEVRDDQLYTWAGVALLVGPTNAEALKSALEANGAGWAVHQLGGSGIQLSNVLTQGMLDAFIAAGLTFCQVLKSTGIHYITPLASNGLTVTDQEIAAALLVAKLAKRKRDLRSNWQSRFDMATTAIDAWDGSGSEPSL